MSLTSKITEEFPPLTAEKWAELFLKETKQEELRPHYSYLGFDFLPFYTAGTKYTEQARLLQQLSPINDEGWSIMRHFAIGNNTKETNGRILAALNKGTSSLVLVGDVKNEDDLDVLLKDVMAEYIGINFISQDPLITAQLYFSWCKKNGTDPHKLSGAVYHDPIGRALKNGGWINGRDKDLEKLFTHFDLAPSRHAGVITIDASVYHYAGANLVQTIAYTLAHATEYLNMFKAKGTDLQTVIDRMVFRWPVGIHFFGEMSALRAFRLLWNNVCAHATGKKQLYSANVHAETSLHYWSVADIYNNMLRATTQAMAALTGGVNSLYVHPYNVVSTDVNDFSERIATNVQLLLREESFMGKVADPAGGAHLVEDLTFQLAGHALDLFKTLENSGGLLQMVDTGGIQQQLEQNMQQVKEAIKKGEIKILGANLYPNKNEDIHNIPQKDVLDAHPTGKDFVPFVQQRLAAVLEEK